MKKVGILTLFEDNYNYGGVLQAYALNKIINDLGYDCKTISYKRSYNPIYPNKFVQLEQYSFRDALKKIMEKINTSSGNKKFKKNYKLRLNQIKEFKNKNIPHTEIMDDEYLIKKYNSFDFLVSGSDQVWNPNCGCIGYLQMFNKNKIKKISYAASISRNELTSRDREIMIPAIKDFDSISVREITAKNLLKDEVRKDISVVLDPTLLLDRKKWDEISEDVDNLNKENYVFCYFFSNSIEYREKIQNFCKEKDYRLIYIPYARQEYNSYDDKGFGEKIDYASIQNFISLFKNAKYVFTDSFHGTVFSIIYEKKFLTIYREKDTKVSMNSRMRDFLTKLKLENRLTKSVDESYLKKIRNEINYKEVYQILEKSKKESIDFLKNALK